MAAGSGRSGLSILALICASLCASAQPTGGPRPPGQLPAYRSGQGATGALMEYFHALGHISEQAGQLQGRPQGSPVGDRNFALSPESKELLRQIQADAQYLQQKWLEWPQRHPGQNPYPMNIKLDPYMKALEGNAKKLREAKSAPPDQQLIIIRAVARDLSAKAANCRHSKDGLGRDIAVTVRTLQNAKEIGGYKVWCAPMALADDKSAHIRFPKVSSPSVHKRLPPGYYAMWLEKNDQSSKHEGHQIGGRGQTELEIDLVVSGSNPPVPSPAPD
jgi:hypothetical protein